MESPRIESEVVGSPPKQALAMLPGSLRLCLVGATVAPYEAGNKKGKMRQTGSGAYLIDGGFNGGNESCEGSSKDKQEQVRSILFITLAVIALIASGAFLGGVLAGLGLGVTEGAIVAFVTRLFAALSPTFPSVAFANPDPLEPPITLGKRLFDKLNKYWSKNFSEFGKLPRDRSKIGPELEVVCSGAEIITRTAIQDELCSFIEADNFNELQKCENADVDCNEKRELLAKAKECLVARLRTAECFIHQFNDTATIRGDFAHWGRIHKLLNLTEACDCAIQAQCP